MSSKSLSVIAIAGGSGAGKTTLARSLSAALGADNCVVLSQDSYYVDQSARFTEDGGDVNFDHPDSIEFTLMARHVMELASGKSIDIPVYDFVTHTRASDGTPTAPRRYLVVDGTLILSQPELRELFDLSVFVSAAEDVRYSRRRMRDVRERGRAVEGVDAQWNNHVKPMHDRFVETSAQHATHVVSGEEAFGGIVELLLEKLLIS